MADKPKLDQKTKKTFMDKLKEKITKSTKNTGTGGR